MERLLMWGISGLLTIAVSLALVILRDLKTQVIKNMERLAQIKIPNVGAEMCDEKYKNLVRTIDSIAKGGAIAGEKTVLSDQVIHQIDKKLDLLIQRVETNKTH